MDWKIIIAEIQEYGHLTQPQIAEKCGCGQATISELARGETKHPRYPVGAALKELWEHVKQPTEPAIQPES